MSNSYLLNKLNSPFSPLSQASKEDTSLLSDMANKPAEVADAVGKLHLSENGKPKVSEQFKGTD